MPSSETAEPGSKKSLDHNGYSRGAVKHLHPGARYRRFRIEMGETVHISEIAEKLSDQLFSEFFWQKVGPTNQNWPCENSSTHGTTTHPADVVFFYDEPYSTVRTYVHCDLKSYAKGSIKSSAIKKAAESLAKQISCAEISEEWQKRYTHPHVTHRVVGLLFVYNHDGDYDANFSDLLKSVDPQKLGLAPGAKLYILGPDDIFWLDNVRFEICAMRGSSGPHRLPGKEKCKYFYPHQVRRTNIRPALAKAATLDMLSAPWIVLEHEHPDFSNLRGVIIFYRRKAETTLEFMYLIDYLRHYQLLDKSTAVQIKVLASNQNATANFQKAATQYIDESLAISGEEELAEIIKRIKCSAMTQVVTSFSTIDLGMGYEGR